MNRRRFLGIAFCSSIELVSTGILRAENLDSAGRKVINLSVFNKLSLSRDGLKFDININNNRDYLKACYLLRDTLSNESAFVHPWLLNTAATIQAIAESETKKKCELIIHSGYRTSKTNKIAGGAKHSYHLKDDKGIFYAMDFHINGIKCSKIADIALKLQQGGVGLYLHKQFIHLDVGKPRKWQDV